MRSPYTRLVLWLIRPAIERIADERIAVAMRTGGPLWKAGVDLDGGRLPDRVVMGSISPANESSLGELLSEAIGKVCEQEAASSQVLKIPGLISQTVAGGSEGVERWRLNRNGDLAINPGDEVAAAVSSCPT